jgi:hypothetical protein
VINDLKNEAGKIRFEIEDKQSLLEALQSEVESLRQTLVKANAPSPKPDEFQTKVSQAH